MHELLSRLSAPFPPSAVEWRVTTTNKEKTKGMAACYIDARDVATRLDDVMGCDWQDEIIVQPGLVTCRIGLWIDGSWRWRQDGSATVLSRDDDKNIKADQERGMHSKGAMSDAFKRAGVKWGIGRYLYSLPSPWVAINQYKGIEKAEMPKLANIIERHFAEWSKARRPAAVQQAPQPQRLPPPDRAGDSSIPQDDDAPEPGSFEPDESGSYDDGPAVEIDRETHLAEARKNADFRRIELLLNGNAKTHGDVHRIIHAPNNLAAVQSWPTPWKDIMREMVKETLARTAPEAQAA